MNVYCMDDCTIAVPPGFRDKTTNVLEWKTEEGDSVTLVVQREPLPLLEADEASRAVALQSYVAAQTAGYAARFTGFRLERDEVASGEARFQMRRKAFRFLHEQDVLYTHQAFVLAGDNALVLTGAAKARHRDAVDRLIDGALDDLRIRGD